MTVNAARKSVFIRHGNLLRQSLSISSKLFRNSASLQAKIHALNPVHASVSIFLCPSPGLIPLAFGLILGHNSPNQPTGWVSAIHVR
jgi:hypothetical protein